MTYNIQGGFVSIPGDTESIDIHGGVINLYGRVGRLIQHGGIINRFADADGRPQQPKVVYRDRIVWKDKVVYRDKVVIRDREDCQKELRELRGAVKYWQSKADNLEQENQELKQYLDDTERDKLLREVEELSDKLKAALNREQVLIHQRKEADRRAQQTIATVWDEYRPTKEACRQLYENLKAFLDCETEKIY
jgi:hypothetical protein